MAACLGVFTMKPLVEGLVSYTEARKGAQCKRSRPCRPAKTVEPIALAQELRRPHDFTPSKNCKEARSTAECAQKGAPPRVSLDLSTESRNLHGREKTPPQLQYFPEVLGNIDGRLVYR